MFWEISATVLTCIGLYVLFIAFGHCDIVLQFYSIFGKKPESLRGQVVWITGASSGIGEALAYRLAREGCKLVLSARRGAELHRVKKECLRQCNGLVVSDILVMPFDVANTEIQERLVQEVLQYFTKLDILVNNAGRAAFGFSHETSHQVDHQIISTNLMGPVSLTKAVLPHFIERKQGHIVVNSSVYGKIATSFSSIYCLTKFGLHGYFDALRMDYNRNGISVTMIAPGPVYSDVLKFAATTTPTETLNKAWAEAHFPLTTAQCADLMAVAIANKVTEAWISRGPSMWLTHMNQWFPNFTKQFLVAHGLTLFEDGWAKLKSCN